MSKSGRRSLREKLLISLMGAVTPIILVAGLGAYFDAQDGAAQRRGELLLTAGVVLDRVAQSLTKAEAFLNLFAADAATDCGDVFRKVKPAVPSLRSVAFYGPDGGMTCSSAETTRKSVPELRWLTEAWASSDLVRTDAYYGEPDNVWLFSILKGVPNETGGLQGVAAFDIRVTDLARLLTFSSLPGEVEAALADASGRVFGSNRLNMVDADWLADEMDDDLRSARVDGESLDIVAKPIGAGQEVFAILSRPAPGLASQFTLRPARAFGLPLVAFCVTLLAVWLAVDRLVLRWLARLRRLADIYAAGRYKVRARSELGQAPREIAGLAEAMNEMAEQVQQRDDNLKAALATRDAAVREIHHRVKNNLQIVTSFLNLQGRQLRDSEARQAIAAARHRIDALSIVHQTLYQYERLETVKLKPFFEVLLQHLSGALGAEEVDVEIGWEIADVERSADDAIPLALFVVEVVTNAMKYAFDEEGGRIDVRLTRTGDGLELTVKDDGLGQSESGGSNGDGGGSGLGGRLMAAFARQLHGELSVDSAPGEGYAVTLTMPDDASAGAQKDAGAASDARV